MALKHCKRVLADLADPEVQMSRDDINRAFDLLNARMRLIAREATAQFKVGDLVEFGTRTRGIYRGEITKINLASIKVRVGPRGAATNWKVSPTLLRKVS